MKRRLKEVLYYLKQFIENHLFMIKYSLHCVGWGIVPHIISTLIRAVVPAFMVVFPKYIIDSLLNQSDWATVIFYIILYTAVGIFYSIIDSLFTIIQGKFSRKALMEHEHLFNQARATMDYKLFEDSKLADDEKMLRLELAPYSYLSVNCLGIVENLIKCFLYASIIGQLHPLVVVIVFIVILVNMIITNKIQANDYLFVESTVQNKRRIEYFKDIMLNIEHGKEIRLNLASQWIESKFRKERDKLYQATLQNSRKNAVMNILSQIVSAFQTAAIYIYAAIQIISGAITLGSFTVTIASVNNLVTSFNTLLSYLSQFKYLSKYIQLFREYIHRSCGNIKAIERKSEEYFNDFTAIEFRNVSFRYPNSDQDVLKNISLTIHKGEKLSIVGFNGAGKSTFVKLLCGLYKPTSGMILIDGVDIHSLEPDCYRRIFSVVWQDYRLLPFTVKENIVLAEEYSENKLHKVINDSDFAKKLAFLPQGIETVVGKELYKRATELSGGEMQKLVFARALYRDKPVLVLDEPTASLDAQSESRMYRQYCSMADDKTAIFISHRMTLSSICDKIILIDKGSILEQGTHEQLISRQGLYQEMYEKQAIYYRTSEGGVHSAF